MGKNNAGDIQLGIQIDSQGFNKQMASMQKMAKKAGVALAAAFSVKALVNFGKQCLELGADLQEVQNVVDTVFPTMNSQINEFAKNAAASYGLSETMAKKYAGTFGAMANAFGFAEAESYAMATSLTGLAGDVASFYNISQDEAYTKLKSIYTGETEALKDLGIVMTQTALDQYALANGFGKTTAAMTEQEKVALRYAFVTDQLSDVSGDFAKTSDSWANQVRYLTLQMESFKAAIGQGLINVLTPVIKLINILMGKLVGAANAFKSFTEALMGKKSEPITVSDTSDSVDAVTASADDATSAVGNTTKKVRALKRELAGFDQITKLNADNSDSGTSGSGSGASGTDISSMLEGVDFAGAIEAQEKQSEAFFDRIKARAIELVGIFKDGFSAGLGSDFEASIERIKGHAESIGHALREIFSDDDVEGAAASFIEKLSYALGQVVGSITSIGVTIGELLIGGLDKYLNDNASFIKDRIVGIYDALGQGVEAVGDLFESIASIFEVFRGDSAKKIASDIIEVFANATLGTWELAYQLGADIISAIVKPFVENEDKIKAVLENTLKPLSTITSTIADAVTHIYEKLIEVYDSKIKPAIQDISDGIGQILGTILDVYNEHVAPVLDTLANKFKTLWNNNLKPLVDNIIELLGSVASLIGTLWKEVLAPLVSWLIETIVPVVAPIFEKLGSTIMNVFGYASNIISGIIGALKGVVDFITGVFSGDWKKSWDGVKTTFEGIWSTITGLLNIPKIDVVAKVSAVKDKAFDTVSELWNGIKDKTSTLTGKAVNAASSVLSTLKNAWDTVFTKTRTLTGKAKNDTPNTLAKLKNAWDAVFTKTRTLTGKAKNNNPDTLSKLKSGWETIKTKSATLTAKFNDVFTSALKTAWNNIANKINAGIDTLNKVPGINIKSKVPKLAQGGYVKKNTPQLAMIGDNRHQGEVVAPEGKLEEMARRAAAMAGGGVTPELITILREILAALNSQDTNVYLDGKLLKKRIVDLINANTKATGVCEIII